MTLQEAVVVSVKIKKKYIELSILIVAGIIYGLSKKYLSNDWYAVILVASYLIFAKWVLHKYSRLLH